MSLTCPKCHEICPPEAERCHDCNAKLALFPVNTRCCGECGESLRGRHMLTRFCSPEHRKRNWERRNPQARVA